MTDSPLDTVVAIPPPPNPITVRWSSSSDGPVLLCDDCGETLCDVEDGDSLGSLDGVAAAHLLGHPAPDAAQAAADERARIAWWLRAGAQGPAAPHTPADYVRAMLDLADVLEQHPERWAQAPLPDPVAGHDFDPCDPDDPDDNGAADECRQCGVLQGDHHTPRGPQ